ITNYVGVPGACGENATTNSLSDGPGRDLRQYEGYYTNRSKNKIENAQDGSSNTLAFGEGIGGLAMGTQDYTWSWMGVGVCMAKSGLARTQSRAAPANGGWQFFSSRHADIVQFAMGDGSVKPLRKGATTVRNPIPADPPGDTDWDKLQSM